MSHDKKVKYRDYRFRALMHMFEASRAHITKFKARSVSKRFVLLYAVSVTSQERIVSVVLVVLLTIQSCQRHAVSAFKTTGGILITR